MHPAVGIDQGQQAGFAHKVHLVDQEHRRHPTALELFQDEPVPRPWSRGGFDEHEDEIHFLEDVHGHLHHPRVETVLRLMDAGRVQENQLGVIQMLHAQDAGPRRLRLVGDDGDFFAEEPIQKRGFSDVGAAHQRHESGAVGPGVAHGFPAGSGTNR